MTRKIERDLVVGLDIGTSKVVVLVGETLPDGDLEIIGIGQHPSHGLKRGVVVNIESTVQSIQRAIEEAELMAGCEINALFTGIAGSHIRSFNSHGIVAIRDIEVTCYDVERVIEAAKAVAIPADQKVIHILPQEFIIDNQDGIREPIGMSGVRLEAKVHMVSGAVNAAQNIIKCVRKCHLEVEDIILEQLASAHSVLTADEKELGICVIDMGAGTTDIAVFSEGAIQHTAVIPIAGDQVTNDIAVALRTPTQSAEFIKTNYGTVNVQAAPFEFSVDMPGSVDQSTRVFSGTGLAEVIQARYEELFDLIRLELERSGFRDLVPAGIVLTGGASKVDGIIELVETILNMPTRIGLPQGGKNMAQIKGDPAYSTGLGLILHGLEEGKNEEQRYRNEGFRGTLRRMQRWLQGHF